MMGYCPTCCQFGQNGMVGNRPICLSVWTEWDDWLLSHLLVSLDRME